MGSVKYCFERFGSKEVIFREFNGNITVEEIIDSFEFLISENKISKHSVGILTNTTNSKLKISLPELKKILAFLMQHKELHNLKLALVVDSPENMVFPVLAEKKLPNIRLCPFSTKENALR